MHPGLPRARPAALALAAFALLLPVPSSPTAPAAARAQDAKALKDLFKGKLVSAKGRRVEIAYDFADPVQAQDFRAAWPFQQPPAGGNFRIDGKTLRADGNAGFRHKAVFDGDVRVSLSAACEDAKDFGVVLTDEERTTFDLFAVADTRFSLLDRKAPLQHMVATFLPAGAGPGGSTEWRYVQTAYEPRIGSAPVEIAVRKKGALNEFRIAGSKLGGNDKEAKVGPRHGAVLFTLGSRLAISRLTLAGVLDAAWLREQGAAFEDLVPEDADPMEGERKEGGPAAGGDPKTPPSTDWFVPAAKVMNASLPRDDREKAAEELIALKERRALRQMIDLMYRDDDALGRDIGNRVFKGIVGKETGFRADLPKEARLKAMERVWAMYYAAKDALEKEEKKKEKP
jgi:hypothetical protein